jgi:hypothetical protein
MHGRIFPALPLISEDEWDRVIIATHRDGAVAKFTAPKPSTFNVAELTLYLV